MCRFPSRTCQCRDILPRVGSLTVPSPESVPLRQRLPAGWRTVLRGTPGCCPGFAGRSGRALSIEVLDGGLVAPGNLVACQPEDGGDAVPLLRAGRPPAKHDRDDHLLVQARAPGQLLSVDPVLGAQLLNRFDNLDHGHSPSLYLGIQKT